jgi:hypothetical protein
VPVPALRRLQEGAPAQLALPQVLGRVPAPTAKGSARPAFHRPAAAVPVFFLFFLLHAVIPI